MTSEQDPILFTVFNEIGIIDQLAQTAFENVLPGGMTVSQFSVLNHLIRLGDGKKPSDLARAFQVTKGAMTNTLSKLEAVGLVRIKPDPQDGRGKIVSITSKGRRVRDKSLLNLVPVLNEISKAIPEEDFRAALPFLEALRQHLDSARDIA
ncbi:MAG: MarR family transcriptional regulator [Alphaproteobacteria bacterium]|nr:MAG: MarR family transcriptional regulator [Alphaproteobacteria bacterium]